MALIKMRTVTVSRNPGPTAAQRAVAEICAQIDTDGLSDYIVECIYREIAGYSRSSVPRDDLWRSVRGNLEMILTGIADGRPPSPEEIAIRRELGRMRAAQALPVDALVGAYHIGYRELWNALSTQVEGKPAATAQALLGTATNLWRWIHEITTAVTDTYAEATRARDLEAIRLNQRFAELLAVEDQDSEELAQVGRALGFESEGEFQAIVASIDPVDPQTLAHLQAELRSLVGVARPLPAAKNTIIILQDVAPDSIVRLLAAAEASVRVGIGLARRGFMGAHLSIGDAERVFDLTSRTKPVARFSDEWHEAVIRQSSERLRPVLEEGATVAERHPHLAEAVVAFGDSGFSVAEAARAISLHANTVVYRLGRWRTLTGWDVHTFNGLAASLMAIKSGGSAAD